MGEEVKKTHLKFLHCSDIHLDIPFVGLTAEKSEERRRVLRSSFMRMMQYVRDSGINVVLMSGDFQYRVRHEYYCGGSYTRVRELSRHRVYNFPRKARPL